MLKKIGLMKWPWSIAVRMSKVGDIMIDKWKYIRVDYLYSINIWIMNDLNSSVNPSENPKVLYGCAVPIDGKVPLKIWFSSKVDSEKKMNVAIDKLSCFITGEDT